MSCSILLTGQLTRSEMRSRRRASTARILGHTHIEAHLTTGQYGMADWFETYPSYEEMNNAGMGPVLSVVDIMVARKGQFNCIIEVCVTNPVSDEKMDIIERRILTDTVYLVEVDADWVMKQSALSRPPALIAKRIVRLEPNYATLPKHPGLSPEENSLQNEADQIMYKTIFEAGHGDYNMHYWTDGMYIVKRKDVWGT